MLFQGPAQRVELRTAIVDHSALRLDKLSARCDAARHALARHPLVGNPSLVATSIREVVQTSPRASIRRIPRHRSHQPLLRAGYRAASIAMTAKKKIKKQNHGAMKVHGKILKGFCAWRAQAKALGIKVELARCGEERARAFDDLRACLSNTLMVERGSGEPIPSQQQRAALATGLAPLRIINYQARPCAAVARYVAKAATAVAAPVRSEASIAIAIAPSDEPRDQRMVDWSAEMALLQLKKKKGALHVVERSNDKPVAHGSVLARLRLQSRLGSGMPSRMAEVECCDRVVSKLCLGATGVFGIEKRGGVNGPHNCERSWERTGRGSLDQTCAAGIRERSRRSAFKTEGR